MKEIYIPAYRHMVQRLRQARLRHGIRLHDAALKVGKKKAWLGKIEQCEIRLDMVHFVRLCRAYRLNPSCVIKRLAEELSDEDSSFLGVRSTKKMSLLATLRNSCWDNAGMLDCLSLVFGCPRLSWICQ